MSKEVLVFGVHAVQSLLAGQAERVARLCVLSGRHDQKVQQVLDVAKQKNIRVELVSRHDLDRMAFDENHQGMIAFCRPAKQYSEYDLEQLLDNLSEPAFLLVLDGVQDPHNLGACLRSADAAGVHAVIAPKDKSVGLTPTVAKVASGAAEMVPFIQVTNLARTLQALKERNIWVFGAAAEADTSVFQANFSGSVALVLGAEGSGLRRLTKEHCDVLLKIPMHGSVSSLNVSVAAGIFLFSVVQQRSAKK